MDFEDCNIFSNKDKNNRQRIVDLCNALKYLGSGKILTLGGRRLAMVEDNNGSPIIVILVTVSKGSELMPDQVLNPEMDISSFSMILNGNRDEFQKAILNYKI